MVSSYNTDYIHRLKKNDEVPLNAIALSETDVLELKFNTLKKMSLRDTFELNYYCSQSSIIKFYTYKCNFPGLYNIM